MRRVVEQPDRDDTRDDYGPGIRRNVCPDLHWRQPPRDWLRLALLALLAAGVFGALSCAWLAISFAWGAL